MTESCWLPRRAITDAALPASSCRLLLALCVRYDPAQVVSIGLPSLRELTGLAIPTIRSALKALLDSGYLLPVGSLHCEHRRCCFTKEPMLKLNRGIFTRLMVSQLTNMDMRVFLLLYVSQSAEQAEISIRMIAYFLNAGTSSICRSLKALSTAGLLQIEQEQDRRGVYLPNRYIFPTANADFVI